MRPAHRLLAVTLAVLWALSIAPAAGAATWYEAYHEAEEALAREDWSTAVRHLNVALAERQESGANVRTYGMRFVSYFPYLKLGIAYYHLDQREAALQAFETELRQGAIEGEPAERSTLEAHRDRVRTELAQVEAGRRRRAADIVVESLGEAKRLEASGETEEALDALGKALSVAPDQVDVREIRARLLSVLAASRLARDRQARFEALVARGRSGLASGRYRLAAAALGEALELDEVPAVRALLRRVQGALADEIENERTTVEKKRLIEESLRRATELGGADDPRAALAEVQAVLALEPGNPEASRLQSQLLAATAAAETFEAAAAEIDSLLTESDGLMAQGDFEGALRVANRVLVLDPSNETALQRITQGYTRLGDRLLAMDDAPPVIVLDESLRDEASADARVVRSSSLAASGRVYDRTPVAVQVRMAGELVETIELRRQQLGELWVTEFRFEERIPAGASVFKVTAVDDGGNEASVERSVQYVVPFWRSVWLPLSAFAIVAMAAGWLWWRRVRRRNRLLHGRFNPYVAGAPILDQERFFGRRRLLDYVLRRICNNSVMLYGERRIGKTSFQHLLKRRLAELDDPQHEFFPVFVDLQGIPEDKFFATLATEVFHELAPKLGGLQPTTELGGEYGYREFVRDLQKLLPALESRTPKKPKLVLLIDEVDELNHYDPRINQRLRSLFMRGFADRLVAVVSGVAIKKQWEREGSPWYNFFQEVEVKPLDAAEARSLIEAPIAGVFGFESGVADEIIARTHSKPYLIQRLCSGLVDRMHEERRRTITAEDVESACAAEGL